MVLTAKEKKGWSFAVDRGGTFTDVVAVDPDGHFHTRKLLSRSTEYPDPSLESIRRVLGLGSTEPLPAGKIDKIRLGTTVATNALLERKGARTLLLITSGMRDLLEIGSQARPDIFALSISKPPLLYDHVIEVDERIGPDGAVVSPIDKELLREKLKILAPADFEAVSVVLMHSWKNPEHESLCRDILDDIGLSNIFLSHECVNLIKIVTRGRATLVDAYLSLILNEYISSIERETESIPIEFIQSSGGLTDPAGFNGKDAIFSGPAGGVVAVGHIFERQSLSGAVGFDMGGTSTDVSRFSGEFERVYEETVDGLELQGESLNIVTVASGGGSILSFDGNKMNTGPESAGAWPGPASYGFGGPLTLTDANLLTGRLLPEFFPKSFGPGRDEALNILIVEEKFRKLTDEINSALGKKISMQDVALGFIEIANEKMALAVREVSVARGYDVREHALLSFGGAGGQHSCALATLLEMDAVLCHPLAGLMSAYGIGLAAPTLTQVETVLEIFDQPAVEKISKRFAEMEAGLSSGQKAYLFKRSLELRPLGSDSAITVELTSYEKTFGEFRKAYTKLYGFFPDSRTIEAVNLRLEAVSLEDDAFNGDFAEIAAEKELRALTETQIYYYGGFLKAPVYEREKLSKSISITGPAIVIDSYSTLVVDPGFSLTVQEDGTLILNRQSSLAKAGSLSPTTSSAPSSAAGPDPVLLEVFGNLFMSIAKEMGHVLANTAFSVNIKERRDFSCALFDETGSLVANAPHIPVHLGSMGDTVAALLEDIGEMRPGDIYITNNPYRGGSHLPDVTVVKPFFDAQMKLRFFTAARGHPADIGGTTPGSMPPDPTHIDEEGVLLDALLIVRDGIFFEDKLMEKLNSSRWPARNLPERLLDIKAQVAACTSGEVVLNNIIARYGLDTIRAYMGFIQENAASSVRRALASFLGENDKFSAIFEDSLDDRTPICVKIDIEAGDSAPETIRAVIDFTGSGPQMSGSSLNAPFSVTRSAILYVLRVLAKSEMPLNGGCLEPVDIIVPKGSILNPSYPSPVSSGNVESSQRIVDVLLGAFGVAAASQGTMNNLLFEVEGDTPYYETIAGGSGATAEFNGASAVQVHMTNTRMTDPEVLETRHPYVRLNRFTIRPGSGGEGAHSGGDGLIRELKFLKDAKLSIISERRETAPYGLAGGRDGESGRNILIKEDGTEVELSHRVYLNVVAGQTVRIETPGGGGFGFKESRKSKVD